MPKKTADRELIELQLDMMERDAKRLARRLRAGQHALKRIKSFRPKIIAKLDAGDAKGALVLVSGCMVEWGRWRDLGTVADLREKDERVKAADSRDGQRKGAATRAVRSDTELEEYERLRAEHETQGHGVEYTLGVMVEKNFVEEHGRAPNEDEYMKGIRNLRGRLAGARKRRSEK